MPSEGLSYFNFMFEPEITILLNPTSVGSIVNWEDGERPLHNYLQNQCEEMRGAFCTMFPLLTCDAISVVVVTCEWCNGDAGLLWVCCGSARLPSADISVMLAGGRRYHPVWPGCAGQPTGAANECSQRFHSTRRREKAPTRVLSLLKAPSSTFTIKNLLKHYAC